MRCGYEAPPYPPGLAWCHPGVKAPPGFPSTCVGYTIRLPQVMEIARARRHWEHGQLETFAGGPVDEAPLLLIEVFDAAVHELETWLMTPPEKRT